MRVGWSSSWSSLSRAREPEEMCLGSVATILVGERRCLRIVMLVLDRMELEMEDSADAMPCLFDVLLVTGDRFPDESGGEPDLDSGLASAESTERLRPRICTTGTADARQISGSGEKVLSRSR